MGGGARGQDAAHRADASPAQHERREAVHCTVRDEDRPDGVQPERRRHHAVGEDAPRETAFGALGEGPRDNDIALGWGEGGLRGVS